MRLHYSHYDLVPLDEFKRRWPDFSPKEIRCRGSQGVTINPVALDAMQKLRTRLGRPCIVTSAWRSKRHNDNIDGAKNSQHLGDNWSAFDVLMQNHDTAEFERVARDCGFLGIGHYPNPQTGGFMHIDMRASLPKDQQVLTRWHGKGGHFFDDVQAQRFAPEPAPRPLAQTGTGAGGIRTITAGVGMGLHALAESTDQLAQLSTSPVVTMAGQIIWWVGPAVALLAVVGGVVALWRKRRSEGYEAGER
jgi:zinc D-Ala-D-Ala carboxypeptidase